LYFAKANRWMYLTFIWSFLHLRRARHRRKWLVPRRPRSGSTARNDWYCYGLAGRRILGQQHSSPWWPETWSRLDVKYGVPVYWRRELVVLRWSRKAFSGYPRGYPC
jgi:hypothetical protein